MPRRVAITGIGVVSPLGPWPGPFEEALLLGASGPGERAARSPLAACRTRAPLLVVHGEADAMVPIEHARRLGEARRAAGLPVEALLLPGQPHAFLNDASSPAARRAVDGVIRFLRG